MPTVTWQVVEKYSGAHTGLIYGREKSVLSVCPNSPPPTPVGCLGARRRGRLGVGRPCGPEALRCPSLLSVLRAVSLCPCLWPAEQRARARGA